MSQHTDEDYHRVALTLWRSVEEMLPDDPAGHIATLLTLVALIDAELTIDLPIARHDALRACLRENLDRLVTECRDNIAKERSDAPPSERRH